MRKIFFPFSIIYWCIISLRNFFYTKGWLRSFAFDFPIICVGNLNTGGTGKTPHTEYLIRLLYKKYKVATLSRGYARKLRGYALATELSLVDDIGDEPKQFKQKFQDIEVCVCENRVAGVYQLLQDEPAVQAIIMDDGLQHRRIKPGLQILLSAYQKLFIDDFILPAGNLREPRSGYKRMQIIVVTKCPSTLHENEKQSIINKIHPSPQQKVFFTTEQYEPVRPLFAEQELKNPAFSKNCLFVSGIANDFTAAEHLKQNYLQVEILRFADHHFFSEEDILRMKEKSKDNILITTEKDAMRLMEHKDFILQNKLSVFILPIHIRFLFHASDQFNTIVEEYVQSVLPV